jgi:hypothetical protein
VAPLDPEFAHASAQRMRIDLQQAGSTVWPFDATMGRNQYRFDVLFHHCL